LPFDRYFSIVMREEIDAICRREILAYFDAMPLSEQQQLGIAGEDAAVRLEQLVKKYTLEIKTAAIVQAAIETESGKPFSYGLSSIALKFPALVAQLKKHYAEP